jgi:hypothetical protein
MQDGIPVRLETAGTSQMLLFESAGEFRAADQKEPLKKTKAGS